MSRTYDEAECLRIIHQGVDDASDLLKDEMPNVERKFKRIDKALRDLLAEVRQVFPDAQYYTASGGFHLMLGASHDARAERGQQELIALSGSASIGDGDF